LPVEPGVEVWACREATTERETSQKRTQRDNVFTLNHKAYHSRYPIDEDWVSASPHSKGKLSYWPGSLHKARLQPAAREVGIVGHFYGHTCRHTYATLLKGNGEDVKVVQELMRRANISVTLNIYARAIAQTK
jgi:site-specific recombinase XerD